MGIRQVNELKRQAKARQKTHEELVQEAKSFYISTGHLGSDGRLPKRHKHRVIKCDGTTKAN